MRGHKGSAATGAEVRVGDSVSGRDELIGAGPEAIVEPPQSERISDFLSP